jgi:hypothetical protein
MIFEGKCISNFCFLLLFLCLFFETGSHTMYSVLALNLRSCCLRFLSTGFVGVCHYQPCLASILFLFSLVALGFELGVSHFPALYHSYFDS